MQVLYSASQGCKVIRLGPLGPQPRPLAEWRSPSSGQNYPSWYSSKDFYSHYHEMGTLGVAQLHSARWSWWIVKMATHFRSSSYQEVKTWLGDLLWPIAFSKSDVVQFLSLAPRDLAAFLIVHVILRLCPVLWCDHFSEAIWPLHPNFGSNVKTHVATHSPGGYERVYYWSNVLSGVSRVNA